MATLIHPTAVVDPRAQLADGAALGPACGFGVWGVATFTILHRPIWLSEAAKL